MGKELWVCGSNAWGQLQFDIPLHPPGEPPDAFRFVLALKDENIEILKTAESFTVIQTHKGIRAAGSLGDLDSPQFREKCRNYAVAGNDLVAELRGGCILQYESLCRYAKGEASLLIEGLYEPQQIVANQACFTVLSTKGEVYTWGAKGDVRWAACLGREPSEDEPSHEPHQVECPTWGPIRKISSGGYTSAALDNENDVYFWGHRGNPSGVIPSEELPEPLEITLQHDDPTSQEPPETIQNFLDVSVGFNHCMVLSEDHELYMIGVGEHGQLGHGLNIKKLGEWTEVKLPLKKGQRIESIHAGYKNSFVIVKDCRPEK